METVREANGTFDPNLTAQGDIEKNVIPVTSALQTGRRQFVRAEILRLELRPQQSVRDHQWHLWRDLQQRSRAVEFDFRRRQSCLHTRTSHCRSHSRCCRTSAGTLRLSTSRSQSRVRSRRNGLTDRRCRISCRESVAITGTSCSPKKTSTSRAPRCASISTWSARMRSASRSALSRPSICRKRNRRRPLQRPTSTPPRPT